MLLATDQVIDLDSTLFSGQSFRWKRKGLWFEGVILDNIVKIRPAVGGLEFMSSPDSEQTFEPILRNYLGLDTNLDTVYQSLRHDERLASSIAKYPGMRLLRQDPWECLISFICSSASNIKRISKNIESICATFGHPINMGNSVRYSFPSPADLIIADTDILRSLGLGYRSEYLVATTSTVSGGMFDLIGLRAMSYPRALHSLISLAGVGDKVANCVMLFSLDKPDAFPVDVWIERALSEWYLCGAKLSRVEMRLWAQNYFGRYAGYANHYLFHGRRLLDSS